MKARNILAKAVLAAAFTAITAAAWAGDDHVASADDLRIKAAVLDTLQNAPDIIGTIRVDVHDGVVTLSGLTESPREERRAVSYARQIPGVKLVDDALAPVIAPID